MRFAERMNLLKTESSFVVLAKAKGLERQGRDIVHFEIGDTDFDTPSNIVEEAYAQLKAGQTHYCPSAGVLELQEACCEFFRRMGRGEYTPDEIVVGAGGKPFLYYTIMAFAGPGDEVIYPNPGFPIYESVIRFVGATPVPMPLTEDRGFSWDVDLLR
ncbi:MAG: aminotransferase class I/II-fold pyridoxal phosphate-dependent enzyme, partial [Nitrospinota bacterium]|nr:aminotransferase class I/II-fold pyridoxal phosphate-dependent enzyme [Nitrospinota bacterium]